MRVKALLFDFRIFAPMEINYQRAFDALREGGLGNFAPAGSFRQLGLLLHEAKKSQQNYKELGSKISELLDEIEIAQILNFRLYPGVKKGLESLNTMKLLVATVTELGAIAAERFLLENRINRYIDELITRPKIENAVDLSLRIKTALERLNAKPQECLFFCNRIEDLRIAKSQGLPTIVLPGKNPRMNAFLGEGLDGMIMTLEELPAMLSLDKFKRPSVASEIKPYRGWEDLR